MLLHEWIIKLIKKLRTYLLKYLHRYIFNAFFNKIEIVRSIWIYYITFVKYKNKILMHENLKVNDLFTRNLAFSSRIHFYIYCRLNRTLAFLSRHRMISDTTWIIRNGLVLEISKMPLVLRIRVSWCAHNKMKTKNNVSVLICE